QAWSAASRRHSTQYRKGAPPAPLFLWGGGRNRHGRAGARSGRRGCRPSRARRHGRYVSGRLRPPVPARRATTLAGPNVGALATVALRIADEKQWSAAAADHLDVSWLSGQRGAVDVVR